MSGGKARLPAGTGRPLPDRRAANLLVLLGHLPIGRWTGGTLVRGCVRCRGVLSRVSFAHAKRRAALHLAPFCERARRVLMHWCRNQLAFAVAIVARVVLARVLFAQAVHGAVLHFAPSCERV